MKKEMFNHWIRFLYIYSNQIYDFLIDKLDVVFFIFLFSLIVKSKSKAI